MHTSPTQRAELLGRLMAEREGPCITLLLPTHRTMPDAAQDRLVLRRLNEQVEQRLRAEGGQYDMRPLVERLNAVEAAIDHQHNLDGLAIFIARDLSEVVKLPFPVAERCVVDATFATREVVRWHAGSAAYHVLVLSTAAAHLYRAIDDHLVEEVHGHFPMRQSGQATDAFTASTAREQLATLRAYHRAVDRAVGEAIGGQGPVVVACTHEQYPQLIGEAQQAARYIGNLAGSHERATPAEVVRRAWPLVRAHGMRRHIADLALLERTDTTLRSTAVEEIWALVRAGRGRTLFVERDLRIPAILQADRMERVDDASLPGAVDDVIDDIIEEHLRKGGEVRILPNGVLAELDGIALLLRY